jgi:DNA-binding HxlR family transcriptional regulator
MQLSELVTYGVVTKKVSSGFPLCVEYSLTPLGESIVPILEQLNAWGLKNKDVVKRIDANNDNTEEQGSSVKWNPASTICQ